MKLYTISLLNHIFFKLNVKPQIPEKRLEGFKAEITDNFKELLILTLLKISIVYYVICTLDFGC